MACKGDRVGSGGVHPFSMYPGGDHLIKLFVTTDTYEAGIQINEFFLGILQNQVVGPMHLQTM